MRKKGNDEQGVLIEEKDREAFANGEAVRCFSSVSGKKGLALVKICQSEVLFFGEEGDRRMQKLKPLNKGADKNLGTPKFEDLSTGQ